jgi:hypothetical protein
MHTSYKTDVHTVKIDVLLPHSAAAFCCYLLLLQGLLGVIVSDDNVHVTTMHML